jgi:hypothetical protein
MGYIINEYVKVNPPAPSCGGLQLPSSISDVAHGFAHGDAASSCAPVKITSLTTGVT